MSNRSSESGELERTLGLPAALAIGIGTMIGAGIFVFPGIAAGLAGPAATISFALAGMIALLVALATAELATAMPASGGGYFFISRTFGPLLGMLVGVAQAVGLVFASAFYLVGFGEYTAKLFGEVGVRLGDPVVLIALASALLLTAVNVAGTKRSGSLQNYGVAILTSILAVLFIYGILDAVGLIGASKWPTPFAPYGAQPILSTTALIFTAYLGFVQIATVAGEIKVPHRTLPRALVGSVVIVALLYVAALFVSTSVLSTDRLASLGETAMVEVARELVGSVGAVGVMGAGLLATLSSANASILSSSRAVYALSRDRMLPKGVSRVHARLGTPHVALLAVGIPIAGLTLMGRVEVLAEVASLLHLIIYGLICSALFLLRRRRPLWYAPTFRAPAGRMVALLGAAASFGLIAWMQPLSLFIGGGVVAAAAAWYVAYARGRELEPPRPPHIEPALREPRILIPVEVPESSAIPVALLSAFQRLDLFVLGFQLIPEQTSPEQAREEGGEEARKALEDLTEDLKNRDMDVKHELVFTSDLAATLNRYVRNEHCQAVLTPKPITSVERLLIPIYAADQISARLATVARDLALSADLPVTLIALDSKEDEETDAETLEGMATRQLVSAGLSPGEIRAHASDVRDFVDAVGEIAGENDVVIVSESESAGRRKLFARLHEDMEKALSCPVLVVLRRTEEDDASETHGG